MVTNLQYLQDYLFNGHYIYLVLFEVAFFSAKAAFVSNTFAVMLRVARVRLRQLRLGHLRRVSVF